jgi:hypothetical protein
MSTFTRVPHVFGTSRASEAVAEVALTAAAAGFTAVMWLSIGAFALPQVSATDQQAAVARGVTHVTLPSVVVVGQRNWLDATPAVTTTAQNTAAIPVNLRQ